MRKRKLSSNYTPLPPVEDSELLYDAHQFQVNDYGETQGKTLSTGIKNYFGDKSLENDLRKKLTLLLDKNNFS